MNNRKSPRLVLERYRPLFFLFGLAFSLGLASTVIDLKAVPGEPPVVANSNNGSAFEDPITIPVTVRKQQKLTPKPVAKVDPVKLKLVPDEFQIAPLEYQGANLEDQIEEIIDFGEDYFGPVTVSAVEKVPVMPGCEDAYGSEALYQCFNDQVRRFVARKYQYNRQAIDLQLTGTVYAEFIVEKDGTVKNVTIVKGVDPLLDDEVIRVLKSLPQMAPAEINGRPVRMRYTIPVKLDL